MRVSKKRYIQGFCIAVVLLGMVRCIFPSVAGGMTEGPAAAAADSAASADTTVIPMAAQTADTVGAVPAGRGTRFFRANGTLVKNRILSVPHFGNTFPDQNDVQLVSAQQWGVKPVADEHEAEHRKADLVYVGATPTSIPTACAAASPTWCPVPRCSCRT